MRISLLLEREPFGPILEQTLANYWSAHYGQPYHVQWQMGQSKQQPLAKSEEWLANIYLNTIFTPTLDAESFDPIKREFARSAIWWKRPLQRTYVAAATNGLMARYFAQAHLQVSPAIPDANSTLIVAGNHKIRLLNHCKCSVINLLKIGFGDHFMRRELAVRRIAATCGVPVPALYDVDEANGWYSEAYMSGTPTNRLADQRVAAKAVQQAAQALQALYAATKEQVQLSIYLKSLTTALQQQIDQHHLLSTATKTAFQSAVIALAGQSNGAETDGEQRIETVITHGDFQPANILLNSEGVWLIDWEYTARRQQRYDLLVFALNARSPLGLAERLQRFVREGWPEVADFDPTQQRGLALASQQERQLHAVLFLLEDLSLHLEENNQSPLTKVGNGLVQLQQEINLWLADSQSI